MGHIVPGSDCDGCWQYPSDIIVLTPNIDLDGVTRWYCSDACREAGPRVQ